MGDPPHTPTVGSISWLVESLTPGLRARSSAAAGASTRKEEEEDAFDWEGEDACDPYKARSAGLWSPRAFYEVKVEEDAVNLGVRMYILCVAGS